MTNNANNLYATTLLKAFDVLDCFQNDETELGISDIAETVNLPVSSVYRIIQTLEFAGLIMQNKETKKYGMGSKILSYSKKCCHIKRLESIAAKHMLQLSKLTGETINLAASFCDKIVNVYKIDSTSILRPNFSLNTPYSACYTATGKIFLSEMSDASLKWVYQNNNLNMSLPEFLESLHTVRKNGYSFDNEEFCPGLRCVAAPLRDYGGRVPFAMSISAPVIRMGDDVLKRNRELVVEYAEKISEEFQSSK